MLSDTDTLGATTAFAPLFRPYKLGPLSLRNRIVMSPMSIHGEWSPEQIASVSAHYRRRAEGGVGLLMTGAVLVDHPTAADKTTGLTAMYGEASLAGWAAVVREVRATGIPFIPQLWHAGAWRDQAESTHPEVPSISPSGIGPGGDKIGEPATQAEIEDVIQAFVRSALNAKSIGFSGVEIAAAHGYLIDQFLWAPRNLREDRYGGSVENRSRFGAEVISAVRQAVGPDFVISLRISQYKRDDFTALHWETPEELGAALAPLVQAGVDVFNASTYRFWLPAFPALSPMGFAGWVKKVTGMPVICVGSVSLDKTFAETMMPGSRAESSHMDILAESIERGDFDLVAVGRALLADPEWPQKVRDGRLDQLKAFVRGTVPLHEISSHTLSA